MTVLNEWVIGTNRFDRVVVRVDVYQVELGLGWHDIYEFDNRWDVALEEWPQSEVRTRVSSRFDAATLREIDERVANAASSPLSLQHRAPDDLEAAAWTSLPILEPSAVVEGARVEREAMQLGSLRVEWINGAHVVSLSDGPLTLPNLYGAVEFAGGWVFCFDKHAPLIVTPARTVVPVDPKWAQLGVGLLPFARVFVIRCGLVGGRPVVECASRAHERSACRAVISKANHVVFDEQGLSGRMKPLR